MSRQHIVEKETIQICNVWLLEIGRHWSTHATLNTLQSFSHVPHVQKANLDLATQRYDDAAEFQKARGSGVYWDCINCQWHFSLIFPHSTQTKESWQIACNDPTSKDGSVAKLSQLWRNIKKICNSFQAQEVVIQSGTGDPEIAFGLWCYINRFIILGKGFCPLSYRLKLWLYTSLSAIWPTRKKL